MHIWKTLQLFTMTEQDELKYYISHFCFPQSSLRITPLILSFSLIYVILLSCFCPWLESWIILNTAHQTMAYQEEFLHGERGQGLEWAAQGSGGVPMPGGISEISRCGTKGHGQVTQPGRLGWWLNSMILKVLANLGDSMMQYHFHRVRRAMTIAHTAFAVMFFSQLPLAETEKFIKLMKSINLKDMCHFVILFGFRKVKF